ncbi:hypothetical protein M885DRAFT_556732 [Pelagophyceae sp. CCMP2097]|nr:hypothetical protein M885DRAFT_556732 [Pelagophyceae sp. CCMP2097]
MRSRLRALVLLAALAGAQVLVGPDGAVAAAGPRTAVLGGQVGDKVGVRLVGGGAETAGASFWVAAPLGEKAWDSNNFGIVSASLWLRGEWGGAESVIASAIFSKHCGKGGYVVDVGSHVGFFTLLAQAHGCRTVSVDGNAQFLALLRVALNVNGFDDASVVTGLVPRDWTYDALAAEADRVLFAKFDIEGAEAAALSTDAVQALGKTDFIYVELAARDCESGVLRPEGDYPIACEYGGHARRTLRALLEAGFDLYILAGAVAGGGFPRCGKLEPLRPPKGTLDDAAAAVCETVYGLQSEEAQTFDLYGSRLPLPEVDIDCATLARAALAPSEGAVDVQVLSSPPPASEEYAWREGADIVFYFAVHQAAAPVYYRARVALQHAEASIVDHVCQRYAIDAHDCARLLDALAPHIERN